MMTSIEELYKKVSDIYTEDEFEEKIDQRRKEFDDLFDDEALAYLLVAEEGRNDEAIDKIKEVEIGEQCTVEGKIVDLGDLRTFKSENGEGRVRNVRIDDGTGSIKLVLWDEDTEMVEDQFEVGTNIRVANGYVQDKGYGKQISIGKWGEVRVLE